MSNPVNRIGDETRRRKRQQQTTVACDSCRRRKVKCDGVRPRCGPCQNRALSCRFDADPDAPPIVALKRRYENLQRHASSSDDLLDLLTTKSEPEAFELLRQLRSAERGPPEPESDPRQSAPENSARSRSGSPSQGSVAIDFESAAASTSSSGSASTRTVQTNVDERRLPDARSLSYSPRAVRSRIERAAEERRRRSSHPSTENLHLTSHATTHQGLHSSASQISLATFHSFLGTDLSSVSAADWGINYVDDSIFRTILLYFFIWDHPALRLFDEQAFLHALLSRDTRACSPMLLHAIIAFGSKNCGSLDRTSALTIEHFAFVEARKLWEADLGIDRATSIPAGLLIHAKLACNALDKQGFIYLAAAVKMARDMGFFNVQTAPYADASDYRALVRERSVIAWGLYTYQACAAFTLREDPLIQTPPPVSLSLPPDIGAIDQRIWIPLPREQSFSASRLASVAHARASLWTIGIGIISSSISPNVARDKDEILIAVMSIYDRLRRWYDELSPILTVLENAPPYLISLHVTYHHMICELLRPFGDRSNSNLDITANDRNHALMAISVASRQIRQLLVLQNDLYDGLPVDRIFLGGLLHTIYDILPSLSDSFDFQATFTTCIKMMWRMAHSSQLVRGILEAVQNAAQRMHVDFPVECRVMLRDLFQEVPRIPGVDTIRSAFPADLDLMRSDLEGARLSNIIKTIDSLHR